MTPLRLQLTNFLSYGEGCPPVEFDGFHVACLCGPNGHGKSALLDGITWALWGQARSNTADDLVRLGQSNMQVEFEFLLDRQAYRIIRKRARGRNSQSDLQLQVRTEDGDWRALTGQGVRDTQARINQLLRMDYETFINSAFILQGRADEFARKSAGDRKKILGEILSLGVYDELSEAARARRAEAQTQARSLDLQIATMEREHAQEPELRATLERLTADQIQAQLASERARSALQEVLTEKALLDEIRKRRDDLDRRLVAAETGLSTQRGLLLDAERKSAEARARVEAAIDIRARAQELDTLRKASAALAARLEQVRQLEAQRNQEERRLQEERGKIETALELARQRVRDRLGKSEQLAAFQREVTDLEGQEAALDRLQEEHARLQTRLTELAAARAAAAAEQARCSADLEKAEERFRLLKAATAQCPLCQGELPEEKRRDLGWKLRDEKDELKRAQGRAIQAEGDAKREETEARRTLQEQVAKLKTGQAMRDRLAQSRQKRLELEEAVKELPAELEIVGTLEKKIQDGDFAPEIRRALAELEVRIRTLDYDEEHRRRVQVRIEELAGAERDLQALETSERELPNLLQQVETLAADIRAREEAIAEDRTARAEADRDLARVPIVEELASTRQQELARAEGFERQVSQALGMATEALQKCVALGPEIAAKKTERDAARKDETAYEELAKAFGRNGIQALIIENALPEIETEANTLLARMSEGELAVRLKTQRELRTGAQAETLEIEISDGMGPRRYELYSGGEAFRVNFAIRIALSKLLARRAGARLETLVIDEGFGSQDQEGRQRLVEAIHTVQDDFAKILVITHLDELKDAFPTRIEVTKGMEGSQVTVY